ncbi:MAG: DUF222 domain-containing protein [Nitriliruptoraceae bacterium]
MAQRTREGTLPRPAVSCAYGSPGRRMLPRAVREAPRSYAASTTEPDQAELLARLAAVVAEVAAVDPATLADAQLQEHLAELRRPIAQLQAARARTLTERETRLAREAKPEHRTSVIQEERRRMSREHGLTHSQLKQTESAGRSARDHAAMGEAFAAGDLGEAHAKILGEVLARVPADRQERIERELLALARRTDPVAFGRKAREIVGREAPDALERDERRRHSSRSFRMTDTPEGGIAFSGRAYGVAAEAARVALDAFRRPDTVDEHRRPEQRGADAFEQLCVAALRHGSAPTKHGVRPQILVVVEEDQLAAGHGVARFASSGQPVPVTEVRGLLSDSVIGRLVRDAKGTPIEVSRMVRTVPAGLWRALVVRDGGCTWDGCDAPAGWCDVAHGQEPYRSGGRLSQANGALLCRRHHHSFDHSDLIIEIVGDRVSYGRPGSDPPAGGDPPAPQGSPPSREGSTRWARQEELLVPG